MGFFEIFMVLVVAIIFLGPDKLPQALVDLAKFFKAVKKTLDDAKTSIDKELNLEELKKEALEYKHSFTQSLEDLNSEIKISDEITSLEESKNHQSQAKTQEILTQSSLLKDAIPNTQNLAQQEKLQKTSEEKQEFQASLDSMPSESSFQNEPRSQEIVHFANKANFEETSYKDS